MKDRPKRHGINAVTRMAEERIFSLAAQNLTEPRLAEIGEAIGTCLSTAGKYPGAEWEHIVGFVPDQSLYWEVTVLIATDPPARPNIVATALIGRDTSRDFCHIVWGSLGGT